CNCTVLSGTLVTATGAATPSGADIGDLYVNTVTGTIYFWDGDSWELTATDNQSLSIVGDQLSISGGNTITVPTAVGPMGLLGAAGANGADGADGNGIKSSVDNGDGTFTLIFDDNTTFTTSD